ncbi:MAG: type II toxin-antitoxin system PemK/MazF family toxin [Solirubrobacteraceae bacterium]|nr:type II toxin-antitoxin system PemK/MazF family toxin [Solirubrobacteraceae bacterium]
MVRGEIFRLRLPAPRGREQAGTRYGVIVQADELLALSTVLIAPTSRSAPPRSFRPTITIDDRDARILVEQLRAIDVTRLGDSVGRLSAHEIHALDAALEDILGL